MGGMGPGPGGPMGMGPMMGMLPLSSPPFSFLAFPKK